MHLLTPSENRRLNELVGFIGLTISILLLLSLVSYHSLDASWNVAAPGTEHLARNWIGLVGAFLADLLYQVFGYAALLVPLGVFIVALRWLRNQRASAPGVKLAGSVVMLVAIDALLTMTPLYPLAGQLDPGGLVGTLAARVLRHLFNPLGAALVALAGLFVGLFLATKFSFSTVPGILRRLWPQTLLERIAQAYREWRHARRRAAEKSELQRIRQQGRPPAPLQVAPPPAPAPTSAAAEQSSAPPEPIVVAPPPRPRTTRAASSAGPRIAPVAAGYRLPPTSLLRLPERPHKFDEDELKNYARAIEQKLQEFEVAGQVTQINPGPVVTTYEFRPEAGVKYSRITSLADDLCLALRAESILIERIPGKSTVGIEVPNLHRQTIALREVVESSEFVQSISKLTFALGKDLIGRIRTADLAQMPHLLIAGATGTGKSVFINSMIVSMILRATPDELKLVLIDPKRLELGLYENIPHLLAPVVTDPRVASNVLRNATREMESRLKLLAQRGVRNIEQYNRQVTAAGSTGGDGPTRLPYIVIVIDELADLMMVDTNNVEESITRLAQMARAVGIHLILATQRPSVDVITGLIKANFPARISFRVATKVDSRTILDANGAEALLGRGDMLYLPAGSARLERIHGPLVTEEEIVAVCDFWREQAQANYNEDLLKPPADDQAEAAELGASEEGFDDELYEEAVRIVCEMGRASTSTLQRRLRIGYGRAARLIDMMERDGIVGPADGPRPREVLKKKEWMKEWDEAMH